MVKGGFGIIDIAGRKGKIIKGRGEGRNVLGGILILAEIDGLEAQREGKEGEEG